MISGGDIGQRKNIRVYMHIHDMYMHIMQLFKMIKLIIFIFLIFLCFIFLIKMHNTYFFILLMIIPTLQKEYNN